MTTPPQQVTKQDIEAKLRQIQGGVQDKLAAQRQKIIGGIVAVSVLTLLVAYLLGKRKGRSKATVVEIRRL
jgi:hypothetical protein